MAKKRFGVGQYQYEVVEDWPKIEIKGVAADVALDSQGRAYVAVRNDRGDGTIPFIQAGIGSVLVLNPDGSYHSDWGDNFSSPHGLWVNADDEIFLADTGDHTITKHAPSGEILMTLGTKGSPGAVGEPFNMPTRAKQAPNGDIYVADGYGHSRIHRFTSAGEHILSWGSGDPVFLQTTFKHPVVGTPATGPGELNLPHDVYVTPDEDVYVMDRENHRWQVFATDGTFQWECRGVNRPNDLAVDADGNFHIVSGNGVEIRTPAGALIGRWGERGAEPGQFRASPHGVWMDPEGSLYVAEVSVLNALHKFRRV